MYVYIISRITGDSVTETRHDGAPIININNINVDIDWGAYKKSPCK